ncbi:hypothetical protein MASR1M32_37110 [Rhodobacter sp.]
MSFTPTDYNPYDFANRRHIGPSPAEMAEMLAATGAPSLGCADRRDRAQGDPAGQAAVLGTPGRA